MSAEDLEDFETIKKNLFNIENFNFDQVLQKYNKDEYIVSIFIKSKNNLNSKFLKLKLGTSK